MKHGSGQFVTETIFVTSETEAFVEALSICELWMEVNWRVEDDLRPRGWRNRQIKDDKVSDSCILAELAAHELAPLLAQDKRRPVGQNWEGEKKIIDFSPQPLFIFPCSLHCCLFLRLSRLFFVLFLVGQLRRRWNVFNREYKGAGWGHLVHSPAVTDSQNRPLSTFRLSTIWVVTECTSCGPIWIPCWNQDCDFQFPGHRLWCLLKQTLRSWGCSQVHLMSRNKDNGVLWNGLITESPFGWLRPLFLGSLLKLRL